MPVAVGACSIAVVVVLATDNLGASQNAGRNHFKPLVSP